MDESGATLLSETAPATEPPSAGATSSAPTETTPSASGEPPAGTPAGDAAGETKPEPAAEPAAPDYSGLTLPDGLSPEHASYGKFLEVAAAAKLAPETAQAVVDLYGEMQAQAVQEWNATVAGWRKEAEADPFLAGQAIADGGFANVREAVSAAARFINRFGGADLRAVLDSSGLGNHPAVVKALAQAGRELAPDQLVTGQAPGSSDEARLRALYPSSYRSKE